ARPFVDEDVLEGVRVARREVARETLEGHDASVGRERGGQAYVVTLDARRVHAHARGLARLEVVHEDVDRAVRVAGHQVRGGAVEGHGSPVGREGGGGAEVVRLDA